MNNLTVSARQPTSTFERYRVYRRHIGKVISDARRHGQDHSLLDDRWPSRLLQRSSIWNFFSKYSHKLHRMQNYMARAVTNSRSNVKCLKHVLASLHWLPVEHRVQFEIAVTTFEVLTTQDLSELTQLHAPSRHLRSSGCIRLQQHRVKLAFAEITFCHAAPAVWNCLPQSITSDISRFTSFKTFTKN